MASKKQQQSMSKISVQPDGGAGAKTAEQTSLEHLGSIFKGKIDQTVIEIVFYQHDQDFNAALESLLSMTGDSDVNTVTPWLDRLQLQQERKQELPSHSLSLQNGGSAGPGNSSDSSPSPPSWSAVLSVNAKAFTPNQRKEKMARKGKENYVNLDLDPELEKHVKRLQNPDVKLMILMRGLPGSGKTTLADHLAKHYEGHVVSADSYFSKSGYYQFDPNQLGYAHEWCQKRAEDWAKIKSKLIIVDNTNLEDWEMMPYAHVAYKHGYQLALAEPRTAWKYTPSTLSKKNSHAVQQKSIEAMLLRFDRAINAQKLMARAHAKDSVFLTNRTTNQMLPATSSASAAHPAILPPRSSAQFNTLVTPSRDPNSSHGDAGQCDMEISPVPSDDDVVIIPPEEVAVTVKPVTIRDRLRAGAAISAKDCSDWGIPAFPTCASSQKAESIKSVTVRDSSAQTAVHDFAELELGESLVCLDDDDDPERSRRFNSSVGEEYTHDFVLQTIITMDKGTEIMSEDLGEMTWDMKVDFLMNEFPLASRDHISEVLNACQQNHMFAKAILQGFDDEHFDDLIVDDSSEDEEADVLVATPEEKLELELGVELAAALEKKFGTIPGESFQNLRFNLSDQLARSIYDSWFEATMGRAPTPPPAVTKTAKRPSTQKKSVKKTSNVLLSSAPQSSLQEIMQYEEAMELSKQEQRSAAQTYELKMQLAKKQQIYSLFPGCPVEALDAVLEANNYDVAQTAIQIRMSTKNMGCTTEVQYLTALKAKGARMFPPSSECSKRDLRLPLHIPPSAGLMAKSMPELREEMLALYRVKGAQMEKARQCLTNKQYMVATYYRQEAEDVDQRIDKLSQAIVIKALEVQGGGNVLDLHFLHVREAICILKFFLEMKRKELSRSTNKLSFIEVITGYGKGGTVPKIKPAVEDYLRSKGYAYTAKNEGCFMVPLKSSKK